MDNGPQYHNLFALSIKEEVMSVTYRKIPLDTGDTKLILNVDLEYETTGAFRMISGQPTRYTLASTLDDMAGELITRLWKEHKIL